MGAKQSSNATEGELYDFTRELWLSRNAVLERCEDYHNYINYINNYIEDSNFDCEVWIDMFEPTSSDKEVSFTNLVNELDILRNNAKANKITDINIDLEKINILVADGEMMLGELNKEIESTFTTANKKFDDDELTDVEINEVKQKMCKSWKLKIPEFTKTFNEFYNVLISPMKGGKPRRKSRRRKPRRKSMKRKSRRRKSMKRKSRRRKSRRRKSMKRKSRRRKSRRRR